MCLAVPLPPPPPLFFSPAPPPLIPSPPIVEAATELRYLSTYVREKNEHKIMRSSDDPQTHRAKKFKGLLDSCLSLYCCDDKLVRSVRAAMERAEWVDAVAVELVCVGRTSSAVFCLLVLANCRRKSVNQALNSALRPAPNRSEK